MTQLREYTEFTDGPLQFPIRGKVYTAPEISIELGIRLNGIADGKTEQDISGGDLFALLLGPVWDEMINDGVSLNAAGRAAMTVMNDFLYGRQLATEFWETGFDPKALAARMGNRATRRSKSTGGARKTRSRASTKATTSPQA